MDSSSIEAHTVDQGGIILSVVVFDRRTNILTVADKPDGPESSWPDAKSAAESHSALAAINGGFFTPEGKPLGLLIENGTSRGSVNRSSNLGNTVYLDTPPSLITRESYLNNKPETRNLLQAGPRLMWKGSIPSGLKNQTPRPRSFILWDGGNKLALGHAQSATLASLAKALSAQPIPGMKITHALNLDGGTSADLWISSAVKGGGLNLRSILNKPVRNYLILQSVK